MTERVCWTDQVRVTGTTEMATAQANYSNRGKLRELLTCQMKSRGAVDAFTEGRNGAIWYTGFSNCSRLRLTSLQTGASGSTCMYGSVSVQI